MLQHHLVQLVDVEAQALQASLADLHQTVLQWALQLLLQPWLLGHQHLHHRSKGLTVLPVQLHKDTAI